MADTPMVVVGSGIIGSSIAWQLQSRGVPTILVERDAQPQGASYFSFASLTAVDEPTKALYVLKCLGMAHWRRWQKEFGDTLGVRWEGEIRWAETEEEARRLRATIGEAVRRGYEIEELSELQVVERLSNSRPSRVLAACYAPQDGHAEPRRAIARLREAFEEKGGTPRVGRAGLSFEGDQLLVRVGDDMIEASGVVVATGAETHAFFEKLGWDIPMVPSPGLLVVTDHVEPLLPGVVYINAGTGPSIHLRQLNDGRVVIGERTQEFVVKEPNIGHAKVILKQAQKYFPALTTARIQQFTVEWRPMPADGMPIIGPLPGVPSIYVATGHSGVTLAPVIAELVAQELVDHKPASHLDQCRPARFATRRLDLAQEVESAFAMPSEVFLG